MQRRIRLKPAWVIAGVLVVVIAAGGGAWAVTAGTSTSAKPTYLTAKVSKTTVAETVQATGTAQASQTVALSFGGSAATSGGSGSSSGGSQSGGSDGSSSSSGQSATGQAAASGAAKVTSVSVAVGDTVTVGQELAIVDDTAQQQQLTLAKAQLAQAEAGTPTTTSGGQTGGSTSRKTTTSTPTKKPTPKPTPSTHPSPSPSPSPSTSMRPAMNSGSYVVENVATSDSQQLAIQQAQQAVTQAADAIAATTLKAPFAGVVMAVNVSVGVPPPSSNAMSVRTDTMVVQASVPEADVSHISAGQAASVTFTALGSGSTPATVVSRPVEANTSSGSSSVVTFPVSLSLSSLPTGLLPGMTAAVSVTVTSHAGVLAVPTTAIGGTDDAPTVQLMGADGQPVTTNVEIGLTTSQLTEVVVGLTAGQTVVTGVVNPQQSTGAGTTGGGLGGRTGFGGGTGSGLGGGGGGFTGRTGGGRTGGN
jgi:macrolide-specific efflux system membrane fusion protein